MTRSRLVLPLAALAAAAAAGAYPLDAYEQTGITRLEAYRRVQEADMRGRLLPQGAQLPGEAIALRLADRPGFRIPEPDPAFTRQVKGLLPEDADRYGVAVLDLTDPDAPRYAAYRAGQIQNPGSVGKILVALAFFQALADAHPDDVDARLRVLRETRVTASEWIHHDHHVVPFWEFDAPELRKRPLQEGDTANLYTWLDWMLSASSNAAAATLQKELLLLAHFGARYPVPAEEARQYLADTPKAQLGERFVAAQVGAVSRNGLDSDRLRQGSFFTRTGKNRVPGTNSVATAEELVRFVVQMEKGRLVDAWSSLEIKKLLYLTDRRIRYASSPALYDFPVYFKSGSLYSCQPEPGFECKKYHGNRLNYMNSITVVEGGGERPGLYYATSVLSNVLRMNSAVIHQTLGTRIHRRVVDEHAARWQEPEPAPPPEPAPAPDPPAEPEGATGDAG